MRYGTLCVVDFKRRSFSAEMYRCVPPGWAGGRAAGGLHSQAQRGPGAALCRVVGGLPARLLRGTHLKCCPHCPSLQPAVQLCQPCGTR